LSEHVCSDFLKDFKAITRCYSVTKSKTLESIENRLTVLQQKLNGSIDADAKLNYYAYYSPNIAGTVFAYS
jgi:hypothetical protein